MSDTWTHFKEHFYSIPEIGLQLDCSRMKMDETALTSAQKQEMFFKMQQLEQGAISNPDENRMVGHYWLREPSFAPSAQIQEEIRQTQQQIQQFVQEIQSGKLCGEKGKPFSHMIVIGVGGSILGPCFVIQALKQPAGLKAHFMDNTDPDGMDRIFAELALCADQVLTIVISKSGSTAETRNGMEEVRHFYRKQGLSLAKHAVAITQENSQLDRRCKQEHWLMCFPMWDWVGGRTSVTSAVGLLPLALAGADIQSFLQGARLTDAHTRIPVLQKNPAALLAASWYKACPPPHHTQMIILPYKDRLELLAPYLQQLIMESLGKEKNRQGELVHQGIAVWGRKGSSDQHSYMQQLLDGPDNFFITFIEILKDRESASPVIADESTSGDFLQAFLLGSREALTLRSRQSITITLPQADAFHLGVLIALYERAVGFYAELAQINAYHQPAVELGKKSASAFIALKNRLLHTLKQSPNQFFMVEELAQKVEAAGKEEWIFKLLQHLLVNEPQIQCQRTEKTNEWTARYGWVPNEK